MGSIQSNAPVQGRSRDKEAKQARCLLVEDLLALLLLNTHQAALVPSRTSAGPRTEGGVWQTCSDW